MIVGNEVVFGWYQPDSWGDEVSGSVVVGIMIV